MPSVSSFEEFPLQQNSFYPKRPRSLKGPCKVIRLCLLAIVLPCLLILLPLYMRYHRYGDQLYPFAVSDMRIIDNRISTTWCQRQIIRANATFNAFLLSDQPKVVPELQPMSMMRELSLGDDMKEYWGFYLLKGSQVTVSTCSRWPGASLIIIRGYKHLHECAYIGDDSSEELDEIQEALADGTYVHPSSESDSQSNDPQLMKRHRSDVNFLDPSHQTNRTAYTLTNRAAISEETDTKTMRRILDALSSKTKKQFKPKHYAKGFNTTEKDNSEEELFKDVLEKLQTMGDKGQALVDKLNLKLAEIRNNKTANGTATDAVKAKRKRDLILSTVLQSHLNENDENNDAAIEEDFVPDGIADHRGSVNETTINDKSNSEFWSSFSSSEEALLNCAGLILSLPLNPHRRCHRKFSEAHFAEASVQNAVTYKVPLNGYYFFVFNSENEVQENYIRVKFDIQKSVYNISNSLSNCTNATGSCALDLKFFSNEKTVMEVPFNNNESSFNEEYAVLSECEPRELIYIICVLAVPILVMLFAFQ